MKYKFDNNKLINGQIKELLRDFNLPVFPVYKEWNKYEGKIYIDGNKVIRITKGNKQVIGDYIFGNKYDYTKNFIINSSIYDSTTHYYLGEYLRFYRDYTGINLMPLYNCFGGESPIGLNYSITTNKGILDIDSSSSKYNYYIVPIKFNQDYTIGIDSPTKVEICSIIYTGDLVLNISKELTKRSYKKYPGSTFLNPIHYNTKDFIDPNEIETVDDISNNTAEYYKFEKNLRLLIKIPKQVNTTITVLEGNYECNQSLGNMCTKMYTNGMLPTGVTPPTNLSLLKLSDGNSYPFADRLIEYLTGNVITPDEKITNNIYRLQQALYKNGIFKGYRDIWGDEIKNSIYSAENKKYNNVFYKTKIFNGTEYVDTNQYGYERSLLDNKYDLLAYGDKDLEQFIGGDK